MIVTPDDPVWAYAFSLAADPIARAEVTYSDLTVYYADAPDHPFPITSLSNKALKEALYDAWEEHVVVCTTHKRFIPCRSEGDHEFSIEPDDVQVVRTLHDAP